MEPGTSPELRSSYKEHIEKSKLQHTTSVLFKDQRDGRGFMDKYEYCHFGTISATLMQ
jgi:hypothetical protein